MILCRWMEVGVTSWWTAMLVEFITAERLCLVNSRDIATVYPHQRLPRHLSLSLISVRMVQKIITPTSHSMVLILVWSIYTLIALYRMVIKLQIPRYLCTLLGGRISWATLVIITRFGRYVVSTFKRFYIGVGILSSSHVAATGLPITRLILVKRNVWIYSVQ